jgi:hypothetical protein
MTRPATIHCSIDYADKRDQVAKIDETVKLVPRAQAVNAVENAETCRSPAKTWRQIALRPALPNVRVSTTLHRKNVAPAYRNANSPLQELMRTNFGLDVEFQKDM